MVPRKRKLDEIVLCSSISVDNVGDSGHNLSLMVLGISEGFNE